MVLQPKIIALWLIICSSAHLTFSQKQIDPEIQKVIDDFITNQYLPTSNTSSLALTIVRNDGEILYTTGYGLADMEKGIPVGNDTQFLIASITKSVTSIVVAEILHERFPELVESVLDVPIRQLVPSANFTLNDRFRSEHGSFRDLLAHRMCLAMDDLSQVAEIFNTTEETLYRQRYAKEMCGIRSNFMYNNHMYAMAGDLIAKLAGRSFEELAEDLLTRIGLTNSEFVKSTDDLPEMSYRAQPYYNIYNISYPMNPELVKRIITTNAAGGLLMTPNDMAKYMRFHLNEGAVDGTQIVAKEVMQWLSKPIITIPMLEYKSSKEDKIVTRFSYGLGLYMGSYDGWQFLQHSGYFAPYSSLMTMFPAKNLGIFTSHNQAPVLIDRMLLHNFIFDVLNGAQNANEKTTKLMEQNKAEKQQKIKAQMDSRNHLIASNHAKGHIKNVDEIVGKYGSGRSGDVEISEKFNESTNSTGIYLDYGKWAKGWMENVGGSLYQITWDTDFVQENYAGGNYDGRNLAIIANETLDFVLPMENDELVSVARFWLGLSLDKLPPIPWEPDSCGPE